MITGIEITGDFNQMATTYRLIYVANMGDLIALVSVLYEMEASGQPVHVTVKRKPTSPRTNAIASYSPHLEFCETVVRGEDAWTFKFIPSTLNPVGMLLSLSQSCFPLPPRL